MYERWATEYGVAYMIPSVLGQTRVVLYDPRAIAHFYARETWIYVQTPLSLALLEASVCQRLLLSCLFDICCQIGRGLLWSRGEAHRRYCLTLVLTPATDRLSTTPAN